MSQKGCMAGAIREILSARAIERIDAGERTFRHAGVLIPLTVEEGVCSVLFTERTHTVEHHKGQISFPGGRVDASDPSFEATAVREAHEEIGLPPGDVEVLGRLDDTLTLASNFVIHPVVARIRPTTDFVVNRAEVERVFHVPLAFFLTAGVQETVRWVEYEGVRYRTVAYQYGDDLIWGATARIMENFVEIISPNLALHLETE